MGNNYWRLDDKLLDVSYAFIDHKSGLAKAVFMREKIKVRVKRSVLRRGMSYGMVICSVRKKDAQRFEQALDKFANQMLLLGYSDYMEVCEGIGKIIQENEEKELID